MVCLKSAHTGMDNTHTERWFPVIPTSCRVSSPCVLVLLISTCSIIRYVDTPAQNMSLCPTTYPSMNYWWASGWVRFWQTKHHLQVGMQHLLTKVTRCCRLVTACCALDQPLSSWFSLDVSESVFDVSHLNSSVSLFAESIKCGHELLCGKQCNNR